MKLVTSLVVVTVLASLSHLRSVEASHLPIKDQTSTLLESFDQEGHTDVTSKNIAEDDKEDDISFENHNDEDPDWSPVGDGGDYDDVDDDDNDDGDNDYDYNEDSDGDNDYDYNEDSDGDNDTHETKEDPLWLSDDDPDWDPEEHGDEDYTNDGDPIYEELLQQVAQMLQSTAQSLPEEGISETRKKEIQDIIDSIRDTLPTKTAARSFLNQLLILASENNKHLNDISKEDESSEDLSTYGEVDDQDQSHKVPSNKVRRHAHHTQNQDLDQIRQYQSAKGQSPVGLIRETLDNREVDGDRTINEFSYPGSGQVDNSQLSQGVEPLGPQLQKEVGEGVEPEDASGVGDRGDRPSFLRWLEKGWGQVTDTVDNLGDKAEDTLSQWGDKIADAADTVHKAASQVVDKVQDAAQSTGEKITTAFQRAKEELPNLQATILSAFSKFGTLIQQGARYCLDRLTHTLDQVRGSEILDKLERKLTEGNAQVAKLFQMLGQKVSEWKQEQVGENVDEGLIIHHHEEHTTPQENAHIEEAMPNFFEDDPIRQQLEKLVDVGVLTPDDIKVFYQQQQEEQQQDPAMENYLQPDQ